MADENLIEKECQCCCNEVTLMTENEPEVVNFGDPCHEEVDFVSPGEPIVIMFDEETEMYYSDIVHTRETVDKIKDETALIPELHGEVCGTEEKSSLREHITTEADRIIENSETSLTEVPKKQVEEMFNGEMWKGDDWMWLPSMDVDANGNVVLNIVVDENGNATFIDD